MRLRQCREWPPVGLPLLPSYGFAFHLSTEAGRVATFTPQDRVGCPEEDKWEICTSTIHYALDCRNRTEGDAAFLNPLPSSHRASHGQILPLTLPSPK